MRAKSLKIRVVKRLSLFVLIVSGFALGNLCLSQQFAGVEIKATSVAGKVHYLEGAGGNIGVSVGSDGILIVDSQFAPLASKIEGALAKLGKGELKYLLNTHWHGDHTGGNGHFGKRASIVAHQNVRSRMRSKKGEPQALPSFTFDERMSVYFNGEEIRLIHLGPGHTDGDAIIYFVDSNVAHAGDQFFNGRFPYIDLSSGGDVRGYLSNIDQVLEMLPDDVKIIPGHGALADKRDLESFRDMLSTSIRIVETAIKEGKPMGEISMPSKYESWGQAFINTPRWIQILYNGLSQ